jgi:alcohol dehydrogenase
MRSRAAILHDVGGPWSVEEFEPDPRRTGEVLVEMAAAGLCHSDDQILEGDMSAPNEVLRSLGLQTTFPTSGGHEGSRVVREIGYGVGDFAVGDHVVMSFVPVCGRCRWCASGMEYICDAGIGTLTRACRPTVRSGTTPSVQRTWAPVQDRRLRRTHGGGDEFARQDQAASPGIS